MNREEALKNSVKRLSANHREYTEDIHKKFIDELYDDFESRTCENCKHLSGLGFCINYKSIGYGKDIFEDFHKSDIGCNKWQPK